MVSLHYCRQEAMQRDEACVVAQMGCLSVLEDTKPGTIKAVEEKASSGIGCLRTEACARSPSSQGWQADLRAGQEWDEEHERGGHRREKQGTERYNVLGH